MLRRVSAQLGRRTKGKGKNCHAASRKVGGGKQSVLLHRRGRDATYLETKHESQSSSNPPFILDNLSLGNPNSFRTLGVPLPTSLVSSSIHSSFSKPCMYKGSPLENVESTGIEDIVQSMEYEPLYANL